MKNSSIWLVVALLAAAAAGFFGSRLIKPAPAPGLSSPAVAEPAPIPSNLPRLEESDAFVREKAGALSADPSLSEWLKGEFALSRLIAAINMAAHGKVPREILGAFAPSGKFAVLKKGGKAVVDPAGYARYDKVAAMIRTVDAVAAAKVFTELLPLLDAAQRALGEPNTSAREALFTASRELLSAPSLSGDVAVIQGKKGIGWNYADARLENLSAAQKQVLRLGPENQAVFQSKLRAIALALGATGLPQP